MALELSEYETLRDKVLERISRDLEQSNRTNELEGYLNKISCSDLLEEYNKYYDTRNARILIIGASMISEDDIKKAAKNLGINPKRLEFHLDYDKNKHFNIMELRNNTNYSDIIFGPNAHKMVGIEDNSSAIALIKNNAKDFPKLTLAVSNSETQELKITKSSIEQAFMKTQYYQDLV